MAVVKRVLTAWLLAAIFLSVGGCSWTSPHASLTNATEKSTDVREEVWNELSSKDRERIKGTWQDSILSQKVLHENMGIINDRPYIGREVYVIEFNTKNISVPRNFIVFASVDNHKIIGVGYVD